MTKRIEAGGILAAIGALMVLVSLFLDWFEPDLSAWTVLEFVDLLLAAVAIAALYAAIARVARGAAASDRLLRDGWLPAAAAVAFVLVVAAIVNHPPAAIGLDEKVGIWIALAGSLLMVLGTLADRAQVSLSFSLKRAEPDRPVEPRPRPNPTPVPPGDADTEALTDRPTS